MKILFLVPYPLHQAPSQRFRVELFLPELDKNKIEYSIQSFLDEAAWATLYKNGGTLSKLMGVIRGYARRWVKILFGLGGYDFVFIHREAAPLGPPVFEWVISKLFRKKIIYDFDDAIWIPNTSAENKIVSWFKAFWKVKYICKWAHLVVGGNDFLCKYARQYNRNTVLIPTCVDTTDKHNRLTNHDAEKITIGWTGSHSTLKYLDELVPVIRELETKNNFEFIVISDKSPDYIISSFRFIPWNEKTEIEDLQKINIGLMPLQDDEWSEGKCGFKLIQYMSLGIPALASPVGVNKKIIEHGENGMLCSKQEDWINGLNYLIHNKEERKRMGLSGRNKINASYSLKAYAPVFINLFRSDPDKRN
ncbi:MAG: glycosyltransferase family 4 protein [Bacteroidetes bacterium]|nr:MAG: glycosyltransferase family 4 protein [Bacteroidota bacterium]